MPRAQIDKPITGLYRFKARGLLEETLVLWGGEFAERQPSRKGKDPLVRPSPRWVHHVDGGRG